VVAQNYLGYMYVDGHVVAQAYEQARSWFMKSAARGNAVGQYYLGVMYYCHREAA
jgi:TPR repeat protein